MRHPIEALDGRAHRDERGGRAAKVHVGCLCDAEFGEGPGMEARLQPAFGQLLVARADNELTHRPMV